MSKNTIIVILIAGLLVFLALWLDCCGRLTDSELTGKAIKSVWKADKAIADKDNAARDAFELAQDSVRKKEAAQHAKTQGALISEIKRLKGRILIPSNSTVLKVDSVCLDQLVLRDSIITAQDSLTVDLTHERDSMKLSYEGSIDSLKATVATQKGQIELADSLMGEIKIPAEKSRFSLSLSAGYGLMSTGGEIRTGIFFGPSLSYKLKFKRKKARRG